MHTFELPSGLEIELREMTGAEEELLTNQRLIRTGDAVNQALKNCIVRLGDNDEPTVKDVLDLLSGDRLFILVCSASGLSRRRGRAGTDLPEHRLPGVERRHGQPGRAGGHAIRRGKGIRFHAPRLRAQGPVQLSGRQQGKTPGRSQGAFHLLGHADPDHRRGRRAADQEAYERYVDA